MALLNTITKFQKYVYTQKKAPQNRTKFIPRTTFCFSKVFFWLATVTKNNIFFSWPRVPNFLVVRMYSCVIAIGIWQFCQGHFCWKDTLLWFCLILFVFRPLIIATSWLLRHQRCCHIRLSEAQNLQQPASSRVGILKGRRTILLRSWRRWRWSRGGTRRRNVRLTSVPVSHQCHPIQLFHNRAWWRKVTQILAEITKSWGRVTLFLSAAPRSWSAPLRKMRRGHVRKASAASSQLTKKTLRVLFHCPRSFLFWTTSKCWRKQTLFLLLHPP